MFKVLSIDYDYFINVTERCVRQFPDGIDTKNTELNELIWGTHYSCIRWLEDININKYLIKHIKQILSNQNPNIPVLISESHVYIYDFILKYWNKHDDIGLVNIDFHHDMFNDNETLDCGNWIKHIMQEVVTRNAKIYIKWIARQESLNTFNINIDEYKELSKIISTDLSIIDDKLFDIIFLCRSDPWSPPHLDKHFENLVNYMGDNFNNVCVENVILKNRRVINNPDLNVRIKNGKYKKTKNR